MRASELLLIVRAQNQASGALRRVAGDLKGLSKMQGLQRRGESLQIARQQMNATRQRAADELKSLETGKRALAQQRAYAGSQLASLRQAYAISGEKVKAFRLDEANLANARNLQRLERAGGAQAAKGSPLASRYAQATTAAERLRAEELRLAEAHNINAAAVEKQALALKGLNATAAQNVARAGQLRNTIGITNDRLRQNTSDILENNKAMRAVPWNRVQAGGRIMQHTARIMEYGGLVLGGTLAATANMAAKFDTSVTLAATQTRKLGQSFKATQVNSKLLQSDIRSLMTQFPGQAEDFSKAAYDIYSSTDVSFGRGRKLLKLFAQAAVAGMTDVQTSTDAGITVLNNFQQSTKQMPKLMQTMFAGVRFGRMTFTDLAQSMATIAPAARVANQSFDDMIGTFAFLTRHLGVAKARVGYARVLEALSSPKMLVGLKKVGIQVQDNNKHLLPLDTIIGKILTKFPKLRQGGTDALNFFKNIGGNTSTIQARRAFAFLIQFYDRAGKDGASYRKMLRQVKGDTNEFTTSLQAMEKTTGVRWNVFINQLKALALAFGAQVVPALLQLSGPLQKLIKWWENLDDSTKSLIARLATFTAAFLLVGGAIVWVAGAFANLFGMIGKFTGMGGVMLAGIIAISVAVTALQGNLDGLSSILDTITNFAFGSFTGFAVTMGVAAVAAVKLTAALRGVAAAQALSGEAGAVGGLAGLIGRGRSIKAGAQLTSEAVKTKGLVAGIASSAALIPMSFTAAGAAIAVAGLGLLSWHMHMQRVKKDAEAVKQALQIGAGPRVSFDMFQQIPKGIEGVVRGRVAVRQLTREIADLRKQAAGATGAKRLDLLDQITLATLDLADAQQTLQESNATVNRQFNAYTQGLARFNAIAGKAKSIQQAIRDEQIRSGSIRDHRIDNLRAQYRGLLEEAKTSAAGIERVFTGVVSRLSRMQLIPKVSPTAMRDMFNISKQAGRMLTIPEMKAIIRAEVDPRARAQIPADIRGIFSKVKTQRIKVEAEKTTATKDFAKLARSLKVKPVELKTILHPLGTGAKAERAKAVTIFGKTIHQKVKVDMPGNLAQIGADIAAGIQASVSAHPITGKVVYQSVVQPYKNALKSHSPSQVMAKEVGLPIVQGINQGILMNLGMLEKTATITANLLSGKILSGFEETKKKKMTAGLITKDLTTQVADMRKFNNAIARLTRRGAPREMVDQLAALGPDMAKQIAIIANMTEKEWRKYLRSWNRMQGQIKRSMRASLADQRAAMKEFKDQLKTTIRDMFDSLRDETANQFGAVFSNIDPALYGEGLKQAQADYASQVSDFQGQIADLNQQMVDAQKEAAQRLTDAIAARKDELQQAFGQLFSGDWIQGTVVQTKIEWGKKLGFDDLQKDLQSQVDKFAKWRQLLTSLAAKVPPELGKQLEALGPEAVDKLDVLNSGTSEQLAAYVALWQQGQSQMMDVANKTTVDTSDITARMADIAKQIADVVSKMGALVMPHELTSDDVLKAIQAQTDKWMEYQGLLQGLIDKNIPASLIEQISQMGPDAIPFMKAINSMTDEQLKTLQETWEEREGLIDKSTLEHLNRQLDLWFDYGVNIAQNIVKGIKSQGDYLTDYFSALIGNLMEGVSLPPVPAVRPTGAEGPTHVGGTSSSGLSGSALVNAPPNTVVHMTVNATQNESLDTTLNRAAFRIKNTVPG